MSAQLLLCNKRLPAYGNNVPGNSGAIDIGGSAGLPLDAAGKT
jgi:hypothetical protein